MPIVVSHQPQAAIVGSLGVAAGNADYQRWLYEQNLKRWQLQNEMALQQRQQDLSRMNAIMQAGTSLQQTAMGAQSRFVEGRLGQQDALQQMMLRSQLDRGTLPLQAEIQRQRDVQQQGAEMNRLQAQQQHQMAMEKAAYDNRFRFQEQVAALERFQNPFGEWQKTLQGYQQRGLALTPEQEQDAKSLLGTIMAIKKQEARGETSSGDALRAFTPLWKKLAAIEPSAAPPDLKTRIDQNVVWTKSPDGTSLPIVWDAKDNSPRVMDGYRMGQGGKGPGADETPMVSEKVRGLELKNMNAEADVKLRRMREINKEVHAMTSEYMKAGIQPTPEMVQQWRMEFGAQYDEAMAGAPITTGTPRPGTPEAPPVTSPAAGATAAGSPAAAPPAVGAANPNQVQAALQQALPHPQQQAAAMEWVRLTQQFGQDAAKWPPAEKAKAAGILRAIAGGG